MHSYSTVEGGDTHWKLFTTCSHRGVEPQEGGESVHNWIARSEGIHQYTKAPIGDHARVESGG